MVVKKDGTRERFSREKLIGGLLKACEKRPVSVAALEAVADRVEATLQERPEKEIATADIGGVVVGEVKRAPQRGGGPLFAGYPPLPAHKQISHEAENTFYSTTEAHHRIAYTHPDVF